MANTNVIEFRRGTLVVFNILKSGKRFTWSGLAAEAKKQGVKKRALSIARRIGRIGRAAKQWTLVTEVNREDSKQSIVYLARTKKAVAKKAVAKKVAAKTPKAETVSA